MLPLVVVLPALFVLGIAIMVIPPDMAPTPSFAAAAVRRLGARLVLASLVGLLVFVCRAGWCRVSWSAREHSG